MSNKICPLDKDSSGCGCYCAWFVDGQCAAVLLAKSLQNLAETWGKSGSGKESGK